VVADGRRGLDAHYTPDVALKDLASPANTMSSTAFGALATSRF